MISREVWEKELPGTPSVQVAAFLVVFGTLIDVFVTFISQRDDPNGYWRHDTPVGYYLYAFAAVLLLRACVVKRTERDRKDDVLSFATSGPIQGSRVSHGAKISPRQRLALPLLPSNPTLQLPGFAYLSAAVFLLLAFLAAYFTLPRPQQGIWVHLIGGRVHIRNPAVVHDPLVVQVRVGKAKEPALYFEAESITVQQLVERLDKRLRERGDKIVYVEGEDNLNVYDVVNVMDIIKGLHAEVVMVTPGIVAPERKVLKARSHPLVSNRIQ